MIVIVIVIYPRGIKIIDIDKKRLMARSPTHSLRQVIRKSKSTFSGYQY